MITPEKIQQYKNDICYFLEEQYILENGKHIKLEQWQKEKILRPVFETKNENGLRKYDLALIGLPKKNGKSTLSSGVGIYMLFFDDPGAEVYSIAGDKDQARIIFDKAKRTVERNPILSNSVKVYRDIIEIPSTGSIYKVLSADAPTAHGLNPSAVLGDELWNQPNRDLWVALTYSPVREQPLYFITTYAGSDRTSLLYELYEMGLKKENSSMYMFWSEENLASWIDEVYLRRQHQILHPSEYQRLHENKWVQGENAFVLESEVMACRDEILTRKAIGDTTKEYVYACDLGLTKDRTVSLIAHYEQPYVVVDQIETWKGTPESPVLISNVEDHMKRYMQDFNNRAIVIDPWQMKRTYQEYESRWRMKEYKFAGDSLVKLTKTLYYLIHNGLLRFYPHKELENELISIVIKEMSYGQRIDHKAGGYSDHVIALGMACVELMQTVSETPVFDMEVLEDWYEKAKKPEFIGDLEERPRGLGFKRIPNEKGCLSIWEHPKPGEQYIIGAVAAEGGEKGEYSSAVVKNCRTKEQVAVFEVAGLDTDLFARELTKLGKYYHGIKYKYNANLAVEVNNQGIAVLNYLRKELHYHGLYNRETVGEVTDERTDKIGWRTDILSKPIMIGEQKRVIREQEIKLNSKPCIEQHMTYVVDQKGDTEAQAGCRDDLVIADSIATQMLIKYPYRERRKRKSPMVEAGITGY